jgi:hypothetical protein
MYALSREHVYNCHLGNNAYSALIIAIVWQWTPALTQIFQLLGGTPHCSILKAVRPKQPNGVSPFFLFLGFPFPLFFPGCGDRSPTTATAMDAHSDSDIPAFRRHATLCLACHRLAIGVSSYCIIVAFNLHITI